MSRTHRRSPPWDRPTREGHPDPRIERAFRRRQIEAASLKFSLADADGLQEAGRVAMKLGRVGT